jgi:septum formation inhibitor-activating ATPase MinD
MRRILVVNRKGGVGKTTLVTNLAAAYAQGGKRVRQGLEHLIAVLRSIAMPTERRER